MSAKPLVCCVCNRPLDRNQESVIYLGWGTRLDGKLGYQMVLALCAVPLEGLGASPCVVVACKLLTAVGIHPVPLTYDEWLTASIADPMDSKNHEQPNPLFQRPKTEFP